MNESKEKSRKKLKILELNENANTTQKKNIWDRVRKIYSSKCLH